MYLNPMSSVPFKCYFHYIKKSAVGNSAGT